MERERERRREREQEGERESEREGQGERGRKDLKVGLAVQGYLAHKKRPPAGPYSSPMPGDLWWS